MDKPPGSPPIKAEPHDNPEGAPQFNTGEVINLISDDEDIITAPANPRTLGSPFQEQPHESDAVNLGPSMLSTKPKPAKASESEKDALKAKRERLQAMVAAKQRETTEKHRMAARPAQRTPLVGRSDLFVTESNPGTPDPAETFRAFQREIEKKRRDETLTWQEEIQFERAKDAEQARINKERLDNAFDECDDDASVGEDPRMSPSVASLPDNYVEEPKKRGRKRKADSSSKPQPKKRRAAAPETAEDILATARRKIEAKANAKASKSGKSTGAGSTKKGRKPKYTGPSMLNSARMRDSNIFEDAAQNRDLPAQPTFNPTSRKDEALKGLIASVPEEFRPIAKTDRKFLDDAIKNFTGHASVKPANDGNWSVKGVKTTLQNHQVLGVAFMRQRENGSEPRGGILADQMGLGKTITMLANIINGKSLEKKNCRTTLIVASGALVTQWAKEIDDKVYTTKENRHGIGRVKEYNSKMRGNQVVEELQDCDIVLTTYSQVQSSYPNAKIPPEYITAEQKNKWWAKHYSENRGPLHRVKWHRVVLDEAQAIKNHKSITSISCRALEAKHNWAISGTPILNKIEEFFSIFKFIKEPHCGSLRMFRANFCSPDDPDGLAKLDVFLRKFMIRRTHIDILFNARLLDLPEPKENVVWLEFNEIERNVYEIVKSRFIMRINCISKAGDLDKQYGHIWTMLLRLRQLTSHILLVQGTIADLLEREDFERLHQISSEDLSDECKVLLAHLRGKLKDTVDAKRVEGREKPATVTETETVPNHRLGFDAPPTSVGGVHGLTYKFDRYLNDLMTSESWDAIVARTLCCGCRQPPLDPMVTSCYHIYCHACLQELQSSFARRAMERHRCTECGSYYTEAKRCQRSLDRFSDVYDNMTCSNDNDGSSTIGRGRKSKMQSWMSMRGEILPSAKSIAVKAQILEWIEEDPTVKIIVYSQWIPMLHILGRICQTEGWEFEKYTGHMSQEKRDRAVQNFGDAKQSKRILLASLKCGGLGLNLTMASRVISLDPWWNLSVEQQAFCRVFRIGQKKETRMTRLCVKNTIDAAIFALQTVKQQEIDAAMDLKTRKEKLDVQDLMRLFGGPVREDENGRPFIFAHDDKNGGDDDEPARSRPRYAADRDSDDEGDPLINDDA